MKKPLFVTSEWNFDLIRECDQILAELAKEFGLDTYPNQIDFSHIAVDQITNLAKIIVISEKILKVSGKSLDNNLR